MNAQQPTLFDTTPLVAKPNNQPTGLVLRDYQTEAVNKLLWSQSLEGNDLCILPTGAGKSVVIADLAKKLNKPILILQPTKEILQQNYNKLSQYVDKSDIGIYSASMNEKTIRYYTFATIQSIYKKYEDFKHFECIVIDECHLVNPKNLGSMFGSFLKAIGSPKVIGFTATPYRMGVTYIKETDHDDLGTQYNNLTAVTCTKLINRMKERFWSRIIYNINNSELLEKGYLCPLEYIDRSILDHSDIPINKSHTDFDLEKLDVILTGKENQIIEAINHGYSIANSILVFCSSTRQAIKLQSITANSEVVTADTKSATRDRIINDFKSGKIKTVFNFGVLTTGFDHPELDCIVLVRPTRSIGLYYQMLGRGVRIHKNKKSCKVIDLTSTVANIGKIETIGIDKIDGKWDIISSKGVWHNRELYRYVISAKPVLEKKPMTDTEINDLPF